MRREQQQIRWFAVEIETEALENFTMPAAVAADRLTRALNRQSEFSAVETAAIQGEPRVCVRISMKGESPLDAVSRAAEIVERTAKKEDLGSLTIRRIEAQVQIELLGRAVPEATGPVSRPRATDPAHVLASVVQLARQLRGAGSTEMAHSLEEWLGPELDVSHALYGIRHALADMRSDHMAHATGVESQVEWLISAIDRARVPVA